MKSIKLIAAVFTLHLFVVAALLVQPGCQSVNNRHASSKVITIHDHIKPEVSHEFNAGMTDTRPRMQPTRPGQQHIVKGEDTTLDEAFIVDVLEPLKTSESKKTAPATSAEEPTSTTYEVKRGDNLWVISKKVGVPLSKIAKANNLHQDSILQIGQKLTIPASVTTTQAQQTTQLAATNNQTKQDQVETREPTDYLVQRGDTLSTIANKMNASVSGIKTANNLRSNVIYVGQKLKIPGGKTVSNPVATPSTTQEGGTYKVRPGQTLSDIAQVTGVSINKLMAYNNINDPKRLRAEQELKLFPQMSQDNVADSTRATTIEAPKVVPQETASQHAPVNTDSLFDGEEVPWVSVESSEGNTTT